jgi:ceramide glucosyltransferase
VGSWDEVAAALWLLAVIWHSGTMAAALAQPLKRKRIEEPRSQPAVAAIVPVSSSAPALGQCATSLAQLDYPNVEVLLCAAQDDRAAAEAIAATRQQHRELRACLIAPIPLSNPKSGLLAAAIPHASHDLLLLTDDNVVSTTRRIQTHLAYREAGYGVVSACVLGEAPDNLWGAVDAAFMNGHFARLQLAGDAFGLSFSTGKSILVSREALVRSGGYAAAGETMCEDAIVEQGLRAIGQRVTLTHEPLRQPIGQRRLAEVWHRHLRWTSCRRRHAPLLFALELCVSAPVATLAGGVASALVGAGFAAGVTSTLALLLALEWSFLALAHWPIGRWFPAAWLARELLTVPLWLAALLPRQRIHWRDRTLELGP